MFHRVKNRAESREISEKKLLPCINKGMDRRRMFWEFQWEAKFAALEEEATTPPRWARGRK